MIYRDVILHIDQAEPVMLGIVVISQATGTRLQDT